MPPDIGPNINPLEAVAIQGMMNYAGVRHAESSMRTPASLRYHVPDSDDDELRSIMEMMQRRTARTLGVPNQILGPQEEVQPVEEFETANVRQRRITV